MTFYDLLMHNDIRYHELALDIFKTNDIYLNSDEINNIINRLLNRTYKGELFLKLSKMLESYIDAYMEKQSVNKNNTFKVLNLKNLDLEYIPTVFLKYGYYTNLHLSGNNINFLSNVIYESNNISPIVELLLDDCKFTEVPILIKKLTKLETLSIKNNGINIIPEWLNKLPCLKRLTI